MVPGVSRRSQNARHQDSDDEDYEIEEESESEEQGEDIGEEPMPEYDEEDFNKNLHDVDDLDPAHRKRT